MSQQEDPELLFAQTFRQFQARADGVDGLVFKGEVVKVSARPQTKSLYVTLVITEGPASGADINASVPYSAARFARAPTQTARGRVDVGQVLKLRGRLVQRDGKPFFSATYLEWVEGVGPLQRERRRNIEVLTGDGDYEENSFKYADEWQVANHPGPLSSIVLIASRGTLAQQDFLRQINSGCSPEHQFDLRHRDVPVQGPRMVDAICQALDGLTPDQGDIAVIVRGGGDWSDLRGFDDVRIAEAIRGCSIPVATGIGHHNDRHLADFAADFAFAVPDRAATALRAAKSIAATRERKRRHYEQRRRTAGRSADERAQPGSPATQNAGVRGIPRAPLQPPPPVVAPWTPPRTAPPRMPLRRPRRRLHQFDKVSLLALITSLMCLGPLALALGIAGCYRTRGRRRGGRRAAIAATVLGGLVTVWIVAASYVAVDDARLQEGSCVGTVGSWKQVADSTVDCDQIHRGEVVYRGDADSAALKSVHRGRQASHCLEKISQPVRQMIERRQFALRIVLTGDAPHDDDDAVCIATSPQPVRGSLSE